MGKCLAFVCVLAGCQPLYGGKPQPLKNPAVVPHKDVAEVPAPVPWVEACTTDFHTPPTTTVRRDRAEQARALGDDAFAEADRPKPSKPPHDLILAGFDHYRRALEANPYDTEATLKLALAYDRVLRKGCALALLHRLDTLSNSRQFHAPARRAIDLVYDNTSWFAGYRKEALAQIP